MPIATLSVSTEIHAAPDGVFAVVSDHEHTDAWVPKVQRVTVTREGTPRNGLGCTRRVEFRPALWSTIEEEIVAYEEGRRFDYTITAGMAGLRSHRGSLLVEPIDGGARVTWSVRFDFVWWWGPFAGAFQRTFAAALSEGLATLKEQLEATPEATA